MHICAKYTSYMAQLTLYIPDDVATRLRRDARRAHKSLSAFVVERLVDTKDGDTGARQRKLRALYGSCHLPENIEDAPLDEVEGL